MKLGKEYDAAHQATLEFYEVSPFSVYHPDVIMQNPGEWSPAWFKFWNING